MFKIEGLGVGSVSLGASTREVPRCVRRMGGRQKPPRVVSGDKHAKGAKTMNKYRPIENFTLKKTFFKFMFKKTTVKFMF